MINYSKALLFPILLVFYEISTYLSNDMYLPALPQMMQDIGLSTKQAQSTLTTWFIGQSFLPLIMGIVADQYGRRPVLLVGGLVYVIATVVCAITSDMHVLLAARFIEGSTIPSMMIAGYACIHELYEQKEAVKILALMGSITVLAPALGPFLGSLVLYYASWRGIFWVISIWALVAIILLGKWMPETHPHEKRHPINYGLLFRQYGRVLTNKNFMLLTLVLGFIFAGFIVWITASPLLIIESFRYSPMAFGIFQAGIFAAYIIGSHWIKYLLESVSLSHLIRFGLSITLCGGILALLSAVCFSNSVYPFLIAMTIYSFGSALCFAPLNRLVIEASDEPMSVRIVLFTVIWTGFAVIGSIAASLFFDGKVSSIAYPVVAAIVISCAIKMVNSDRPVATVYPEV